MIIAPLVNLQLPIVNIMGLKPWAFFLIFFIVLAGGLIVLTSMWDSHKRTQNRKKTTMPDGMTRKILGVFVTANSDAYEMICNTTLGEVLPDPKNKKLKASGIMEAPTKASQRIPKYFILPQFCFKTSWPKGAKKSQQVEIMESFYRENFSLPALSYEDMTAEERENITALMVDISTDQNFANTVVTAVEQRFAEFTKAVAKMKNLSIMLYILCAIAGITLFTLFYTYMGYKILNIIRLAYPG